MDNKQLQKRNEAPLTQQDPFWQSQLENLPDEQRQALVGKYFEGRLEIEKSRAEGFVKDEKAQRDIDNHLYARRKMQVDSLTKGADSVTSNIETASGNMKIESKSGACYVATATYQSTFHPNVVLLRDFRDKYLRKSFSGRLFIKFYYTVGPYVAYLPEHSEKIRKISMRVIDSVVAKIRERYY